MPTRVRPRFGSLQYWPRKRAEKFIPRVNWNPIKKEGDGVFGVIGYKVGMSTAIVKDETNHSMTKGKKLRIPVTILEIPKMKIFSVRFYKDGQVMKDVIVSNEKVLRKVVKLPKEIKKVNALDAIKGYDEIRVIVYPILKGTFKKKPDFAEIAIGTEDKIAFVKKYVGKEISLDDFVREGVVDVRGLTRGKGLQGPVKRFGITLKSHKSEKGVRRPGSLGPWHPARVSFRVPMAGQLGMFTRTHYNLKIIDSGNISEKDINPKNGWRGYGLIKGDYLVLNGSVQGPSKRQILVTSPLRPNKKQTKKNWTFEGFVK